MIGWSGKQSSADVWAEVQNGGNPNTNGPMTGARFADRLWGDIYYDKSSRKFSRKAQDPSDPRTFVTFVLEPLYKIYTTVCIASMKLF